MKVAALTMVYRDHWFLNQWLKHYGGVCGPENLFVISHGDEKEIRSICKESNVIGIVREQSGDFDVLRWQFINDILNVLLKSYDAVVVGDVDELVAVDPRSGKDFMTVIKQNKDKPVVFVTGVEIVERESDDPLDDDLPVLSQRRSGHWNWRYTKCAIVNSPCKVGRGAHFVWGQPYYNEKDLILFHLKFANLSVFDKVLSSRKDIREVGADGKTRTPRGNGWTNETLVSLLRKREKPPLIDFYDGLEQFRQGTERHEEEWTGRVFPNRFFINSWFELPASFSDTF